MEQCYFAVDSLWNVLIASIDIATSLATDTPQCNANNFLLSALTLKWVDELFFECSDNFFN